MPEPEQPFSTAKGRLDRRQVHPPHGRPGQHPLPGRHLDTLPVPGRPLRPGRPRHRPARAVARPAVSGCRCLLPEQDTQQEYSQAGVAGSGCPRDSVDRFPRTAPGTAPDRSTGTYGTNRTAWLSQTVWPLGLIWARLDSNQAGSTAADLLVHPGMGLSLADRLGRYQERAIPRIPSLLTMQARRTRSDFKLPMATPERSCSQSTVVARMLATAGRAPGIASCATGYRDIVTIPDIGHCVGSGAAPAADTVKNGTGWQFYGGVSRLHGPFSTPPRRRDLVSRCSGGARA